MTRPIAYLAALVLLALAACATTVRAPLSERAVPKAEAETAWRTVLETYVNDQGQINFRRLSPNVVILEKYVNYISRVSPTSEPASFRTKEARLAYYINSYNALSMYNVCQSFKSGEFDPFSRRKRVQFFYLRRFLVGGQPISLYDYEREVIAKQGEERVHFALNCMSRACPRLPRVPFVAETLVEDLDAQAAFFLNEERNVRVDRTFKKVHLSQILQFYTDDFLKRAPSLAAYVNLYRVEKVPLSYQIAFDPYDWGVNLSSDTVNDASIPSPWTIF